MYLCNWRSHGVVQNEEDGGEAVWVALSSLDVFLNSTQLGNCLVPSDRRLEDFSEEGKRGVSLEWGLTGICEGLGIFLRGNK